MEEGPRNRAEQTFLVKIQVGATEYSVNLETVPYFKSFLSFQQHSGQHTAQMPFFRRMPTQLSDYHVLCETLEFLGVDVPAGRNLHMIMDDMRRGKSDWDPDEQREVSGLKSLARDSAFRLLYTFLLGEFESDAKDSNMAYNTALFVVSHRGIFRWRTRKMVREALEERFCISDKQRKNLDNWAIEEPSASSAESEDLTTESESSAFGSDWSYD